jgi:hypothetical protein
MGSYLGKKAFTYGEQYFDKTVLGKEDKVRKALPMYPNPAATQVILPFSLRNSGAIKIYSAAGKEISGSLFSLTNNGNEVLLNIERLNPGLYYLPDGKGSIYKLVKK